MPSDDLYAVSSCSPPSANSHANANLARFRKFFTETGSPSLPDPSPECIAATLAMGQLDNELYDQFAARGIDLNDEEQMPDEEYAALVAPLERRAGLDRFDGAERFAAMLWLMDHPDHD